MTLQFTDVQPEPLKSTQEPWMVRPEGGCVEIVDVDNHVIGMAHDMHNAVLMSSSTEMLNALIMIQEHVNQMRAAGEFFPAGIPVNYFNDELDELEEMYSVAFEKLHAEADS